jgi:DNA polymerase-3 subunit epsilon
MTKKRRAIYYDTETTGLRAADERIIEIAAYDPERDLTFERFVNPGRPIPPEATAIHHITDEMVAGADDFSVVGAEFNAFCEGDVVLIAHNNDAFDVHFLRAEYARNSLEMVKCDFLDTLKWARRYRPDLPRHTLQFLREIYGVEANNAHRALDDVIVMYKVFSKMIDNLSIDQVFALMNQQRKITHMPFGKHQGKHLSEVPKSYVQWLCTSGAFDKDENKPLKTCFEEIGVL